jgi:hypothetical protein
MKYRYKDTDTVVESSVALDSSTYTPVEEKKSAAKATTAKKTGTNGKRGN